MQKIETWSGNGKLRQIKEKILSRVEFLRLGGLRVNSVNTLKLYALFCLSAIWA